MPRAALVIFGALLGLTPLLAVAALSIQTGGDAMRRQLDDRLVLSADLNSQLVSAQMQGIKDMTGDFAAAPALVSALLAPGAPGAAAIISSRLAALHAAVHGSKAAFMATPAGKLTAVEPRDPAVVGQDFSARDWYRGVTARADGYVSEVYVSAYSGHPLAVAVATPVVGFGASSTLLGILVLVYPVDAIQAFTDSSLHSSPLGLTVIDQGGHLVAGPGLRGAAGKLVTGVSTTRSGVQESSISGRRVLSASSAVSSLGWHVLVEVDKEAGLAEASLLQRNVLITTAALALIMMVGLGVTGASLSQRRLAEQRMSEAAQQSQQLLDGLPVGVFVVGRDGRPQYANERSTELLGRAASPGVAAGEIAQAYRVFVAGTDDLYLTESIPVTRALRGETLRVDDLEVEREDGRVSLECWANPIFDPAGRPVGAVAAFLDVTASKRAQRDIRELNAELDGRVTARTAELAASNEELEAFSYSVSHDLRAPLRAMAGFAIKLQQKVATQDEPELARYAERIAVNARRMGELIDQLLSFSRLNRQELQMSAFSPAVSVERALEDLTDVVAATGAHVILGEMPMAVADPGLVQEVFANLLSNAVKYSSKTAHPLIEVGATMTPGAGTVYYVRDNGAGFDMRFKEKLFGVFQRLHSAEEYEGIGVGLAIVKRIVTRHGGAVFAEGAVNGGATFSFTLGEP